MKHPRRYAPIRPEQMDRCNRNTRAESFGIRGRFPSEQQGGIVGILTDDAGTVRCGQFGSYGLVLRG
ncbi:MAG TPA: hypothetical protein PKW66_27805 [Polyangiaceae bacterium]|nr:hypothetical protein [Polyangiaceae bacterium]